MTDNHTDKLFNAVQRENDRRLAFINGYGAALADMADDDVDTNSMSLVEFRDHVRALFHEHERGEL